MRVARNYTRGIKGNRIIAVERKQKNSLKSDKYNVEICTTCPFVDCKKGICDYYRSLAK